MKINGKNHLINKYYFILVLNDFGGRVGGTLIRDPRVFCEMITGLLLKVLDNFFTGYIAKVFII